MRVTIAVDSFKGSLSTFQSGQAIKDGIRRIYPDATVNICPIADGGEGTVEAIISATGGEYRQVEVKGPLGDNIAASYGITPDNTAVIEMSAAAGITLISNEERNPLRTTTYGVGQLILDAIKNGCRKFIIGIGGSATNDGGIGMLQALGFEFLDKENNQVSCRGKGLKDIVKINTDKAFPLLSECEFNVACDVSNPLCGSNGCSVVFAPQKGATKEMIEDMDRWLSEYARLTKEIFPESDAGIPGTGAAGGLGFAFISYLNGKLKSGIELVIKESGLESLISESDIVITGEGCLDGQSYMGKAPVGIAKLAKKYNKTVIAFSGAVTDDAGICNEYGIDAFFPIVRKPCTLENAMDINNAYKNLSDTAEQVFRLIKCGKE